MKVLVKSDFIINYLNKLNVFTISCGLRQSSRKYSTNGNKRSTLNEDELNKFRSFKDIDWWTHRQFAPLRQMNELRVPWIRDSFSRFATDSSKPLNGINLLEIGCGAGLLAEPMARLGANVTAIDPIDDNIIMADNHLKGQPIAGNLHYECVSVEELSKRDQMIGHFDGVIASEVIEHIDDIDLFLSSGLKCLKKGGKLLITTINQTPIALLMAIIIGEYVLELLPKGTHQYNRFVSPKALTQILKDRKSWINVL